jgi:uncharacterized protein YkwD
VDGRPWRQSWSFSTLDEQAAARQVAEATVALLNAYRAQAGLRPVTLDPALSKGCFAHAHYLVLNADHPATRGLGAHEEEAGLPGYTDEGKVAGKGAVIALGALDPAGAVHGWMATLYHRVPLLDPTLERIGLGHARSTGVGWVSVLDVRRGKQGKRERTVTFPANGQQGVRLAFAAPEEPNPIPDDRDGRAGYPITVTFAPGEVPEKLAATLTDADGKDVEAWVSTPGRPANPRFAPFQGTTVCLIAKDPLRSGTMYRVRLQGTKGFSQAWSFTTGDGREGAAGAAGEVLACINRYRKEAGLPTVALDESLSEACAAHARYLALNGATLEGRNVNDQDPKLPGYSAAGQEAARTSDVYLETPSPTAQAEDLIATGLRRVYLLDPRLRRIGFGCAHDLGRGWMCVLNLIQGRGERVVLYPGPGQQDVPASGPDRPPQAPGQEAGFPITAHFPAGFPVRQASASLRDDQDREVEAWVTTPESPADPAYQGQMIALVPLRALRPGVTYTATATATFAGRRWQESWRFTTSAASAQ